MGALDPRSVLCGRRGVFHEADDWPGPDTRGSDGSPVAGRQIGLKCTRVRVVEIELHRDEEKITMTATTLVAIPDSLGDLAAKIDAAHRAAVGRAKDAIDKARECGLLLIAAKRLVAHGEWLDWLSGNTAVSARQSQKYMRLARSTKTNLGSHSINAALKALSDHRPAASYRIDQPDLPLGDLAPDERPLGWIIKASDSWNFSRIHYGALTYEDSHGYLPGRSWRIASGTGPSRTTLSSIRWPAAA